MPVVRERSGPEAGGVSFDKKGLDQYEEVPDRIRAFITKYPEGSLQCASVEYRELPAAHLKGEPCLHVIYHAAAYRTPEDPSPGHGMASEPLPGLTPYTKGSELMNAETSAWGRALVALGFVAKKIASAEEVRNRSTEAPVSNPTQAGPRTASEPQRKRIFQLFKQHQMTVGQIRQMVTEAGGSTESEDLSEWIVGLTGGKQGQASAMIDRLIAGEIPPAPDRRPTPPSDVPTDGAEDFVHPSQPSLDDVISDGTVGSEAA